jgi:hypothetical protein
VALSKKEKGAWDIALGHTPEQHCWLPRRRIFLPSRNQLRPVHPALLALASFPFSIPRRNRRCKRLLLAINVLNRPATGGGIRLRLCSFLGSAQPILLLRFGRAKVGTLLFWDPTLNKAVEVLLLVISMPVQPTRQLFVKLLTHIVPGSPLTKQHMGLSALFLLGLDRGLWACRALPTAFSHFGTSIIGWRKDGQKRRLVTSIWC